MARKIVLAGMSFGAVMAAASGVTVHDRLLPYAFEPLPLGSIKPLGWLREQLGLMANGLPGHEADFYRYVKDSVWTGGSQDYSGLHEAAAYWFNYIVPLAYGLDDIRLKNQVRRFVDRVLDDQAEDGWIGPERTPATRALWARFPVMLGLMQLCEADDAYAERVLPAMHRFIKLMHHMLENGGQGYVSWGRARSHDMTITLQWLYENHPMDNGPMLLDTMKLLTDGAFDWSYFFSKDVFPVDDVDDIPDLDLPYDFQHVVNLAQALKAAAVIRRFTHNEALLETARNAVNWTFLYHGSPAGAVIGDERISGVSPRRGAELCGVVEAMHSLSYLYKAIGDKTFADRCELAAFNALPAMISPDWWAHQYVSQANQPFSRPLPESPFFNVNRRGQTFGLEPHYPCCTVNHPQGYPKFLSAAYVRVGDNGVGHALLSPSQATISLGGRSSVSVQCETRYPFENQLLYTITAEEPFDFFVRVPDWYLPESSHIRINHDAVQPLDPDAGTGMHKIAIPAGRTSVRYVLGARIRVVRRANNAVSVYRGALLYALDIGMDVQSQAPRAWTQQYLSDNEIVPDARDYVVTNMTAWAVAIDPATLAFRSGRPPRSNAAVAGATDQIHVSPLQNGDDDDDDDDDDDNDNGQTAPLDNPIFTPGAPPGSITVRACEIEWDCPNGVPADPPSSTARECKSEPFTARLIPYGAAKIHMAELPTMDLSHSLSSVSGVICDSVFDAERAKSTETQPQYQSQTRQYLHQQQEQQQQQHDPTNDREHKTQEQSLEL